MIGKTILHYKIIEKLGEGGMGVVYLAEDTKLDRKVAIKFLPHHIAGNSDECKRFEIEAKAAASLNQPNIATIYAIEESDNQIFLVMEYIKGKDLKEKLKGGVLHFEESLNIAIQIAEGIKTAHENGIVHRDIKSSNIMVSDKGKVKIMDFGLAKIQSNINLTKDHSTLGTAAYMSPEQAQGEEVDHRSDIWSFGVVFYEMLTGQLPFKGDYEQAVIYSILNEEPELVNSFRGDVPENIRIILSKLLKKECNTRIQSFDAVLDELKQKPSYLSEKTDEKSVAVLYFDNMSPDKENEYFCAGITEDIIIDLSKIQKLKIIPRSDVLPFRTRETNSTKVGEILGVTHILEGSVRKAGQQIRVTAQLIDVQTGFQIWAERYDRLLEDIFELQIEVSQKIVEALKLSLSESEKEILTKKPTEDLRAHDFYMRGRDFLTSGGKNNNESAIKMFKHALSIDANYSLAYVALAEAYAFQYMFYDGNQKWLGQVISASEKAKEIDPNLLEVEVTKAMVLYYQKRFSDSKRILENFIKLKNDYYLAFYWLGTIAVITKKYDEGIKYFMRASEIKPYSEEPWLHIEMIHRRKNNENTASIAKKKILELVEIKLGINVKDAIAMSRAAAIHATMGDIDSAKSKINKVLEIAPNDGLALYNCACTYAILGIKEKSFEYLQKAIGIGYKNIIEWIENDPDFMPFRNDPEFKDILAKAGG
jgi:serine/threonine protein kinase/Tfp pilus assembly protein PilF